MAPLAPNLTDRYWLQYTSGGVEHEMVLRVASATTQATIITAATALANALKLNMHESDAFTGLKHQDSGSNVSFPLAWTTIVGTNTATPEPDAEAKFISCTGRSLAGRRCRVTFFGMPLADVDGFRINTASGLYNALIAHSPTLLAADGGAVIWNTYTNIGYNSYWQRQQRTQ